MTVNIFKAEKLSKKYGDSFALKELNMTIKAGEIYGLIGENGAGKTTLMKIIGNLVRPTSGIISLFGETDIKAMNKVRKKIGFLIEMPALYPELSAYENLKFHCILHNILDKGVINQVLKDVSLANVGNKKVAHYSLGMKQRLGLAIALINEPRFLVLDEPVNGLDPVGIVEIRDILTKLATEKGVSILISSHILSELQLLATRYGFIHKGQMLKELGADDLNDTNENQICIKVSNPELAIQILQKSFSIKIKNYDGELRLPQNNIVLEKVISKLLSHNLQIFRVDIATQTLEDYYVNLIRGRNNEEFFKV